MKTIYKLGRNKKPRHWENTPDGRSAANSVDRFRPHPGILNYAQIVAGGGSGGVGAPRGIASTRSQDQRPETQNPDRVCASMCQTHPACTRPTFLSDRMQSCQSMIGVTRLANTSVGDTILGECTGPLSSRARSYEWREGSAVTKLLAYYITWLYKCVS